MRIRQCFTNKFSIPILARWDEVTKDKITCGVAYKDVGNTKNVEYQSSVSLIGIDHIGYFHCLVRDAVKKGNTRAV